MREKITSDFTEKDAQHILSLVKSVFKVKTGSVFIQKKIDRCFIDSESSIEVKFTGK